MSHPLDHLLWASPDLDDGVAHFAALSGVTAGRGGEHPGFGTRNALASLGDGVYLEIISPDPAQDLRGNRGGEIAALPGPQLLTFAVRSHELERVARLAAVAGLGASAPLAMSRRHPDGHLLEWRVLRLDPGPFGRFVPFFIDWGDTPHPSRTTTRGCTLSRFEVVHPQQRALAEIYRSLELDIVPTAGDTPALRALIATPRGQIELSG